MSERLLRTTALLGLLVMMGVAWAGKANPADATDVISIPQLINYQGFVTDPSGSPLTGSYDMHFEIWDAAVGGSRFWQEDQANVAVNAGVFSVKLGAGSPISDLPEGPDCWLSITVEGQLLNPRIQFVSSAYGYMAAKAEDANQLGGIPAGSYLNSTTAAGGDLSGTYPNPDIANSAVTLNKISTSGAGNGQAITYSSGSIIWGNPEVGSHSHSEYQLLNQKNTANGYAGLDASGKIPNTRLYTGPGYGLEADLLDGLHAASFLNVTNDFGRSGVATDLYEGTSTLSSKYSAVTHSHTATGDVTGSVPGALTLATSGATAGTYGDATNVARVTVDAKGRVTSASNVAISGVPPSAHVHAGTDITSGTVADARLSSNVALLNTAQTISATKTFSAQQAFSYAGAPFTVGNSTVVTNLNADLHDGYQAGNASGNIPVSNGTLNALLNADLLDSYSTGNGSGNIPLNNGVANTNLNADMLDGLHSSSFLSTASDFGRSGVATDLYEGAATLSSKYSALAHTHTLTHTGDVSGTGAVGGTWGLTLANSGVTAGTYGSATTVPQVTVDAKGRITSASNVTISGVPPGGTAGGDLTGTYPNPTIAANAVASAEIVDLSVATADLGANVVTAANVERHATVGRALTSAGSGADGVWKDPQVSWNVIPSQASWSSATTSWTAANYYGTFDFTGTTYSQYRVVGSAHISAVTGYLGVGINSTTPAGTAYLTLSTTSGYTPRSSGWVSFTNPLTVVPIYTVYKNSTTTSRTFYVRGLTVEFR